jgi:alanyl-tRNA synthetase
MLLFEPFDKLGTGLSRTTTPANTASKQRNKKCACPHFPIFYQMQSFELRKNFLEFFKERGHTIVPSSSLVPNDPSVLFTTAGMQQFKPYFLGEKSPYGDNAVSCQKCLRTSDIESVGDNTHLTFFEMLGNFSFGLYFKEETIKLALKFLEEVCFLPREKLWFSYFKGDKQTKADEESKEIILSQGISEKRIVGFGKEDNFWGPTGESGPCGPTVEIYYDTKGTSCQKGGHCLPNCECGRFVEIWNLVFNQFEQNEKKELAPLKQKGVDTGLGIERLLAVLQKKGSVFETDIFLPIIQKIQTQKPNERSERIIADHIKASVFLAGEGILPEKTGRGYILRRVLRKAVREKKLIGGGERLLIDAAKKVIEIYKQTYPEISRQEADILTIIEKEEQNFSRTLEQGLKKLEKLLKSKKGNLVGDREAFYLFETYGFPLELIQEIAASKGLQVDREGFYKEFKKHQKISRAGAEKKFGGGNIEKIKDTGLKIQTTNLHTATHLLQAALRQVLGEQVRQMGSDITSARLRFDFSFERKPEKEELEKVQKIVNEKIEQKIEVKREEMDLEKAIQSGALSFFKEKYPERVIVYSIGNFSKEICAGPHAKNTQELGKFVIIKEESVGSGVRRIKAALK